jgi:aldehyde oxidoreductase
MSKGLIQFAVNGEKVIVDQDNEMTLLQYLRRELGLVGTKNGCAKGHCGTCTVIIDGVAKRSCLVKVNKLQGSSIETIENLSKNGSLHPIQVSFIRAGAIQCGFCTPGMIMATKALLARNNNPSDEEIRKALKNNLCRCTGYVKILDAVKQAGAMLRGEISVPEIAEEEVSSTIGMSVVRKDTVAKAAGKALYADDLQAENMLWGKLALSDRPHARIKHIDIDAAKAMPGVVAVLTYEDIPGRRTFGLITHHQPVLAFDRVRYVGDPVALVLAETEEAAARAAQAVKVEYEDLPGVFSPQEALQSGASQLHGEKRNILCHIKVRKGDIEEGFQNSDVVVEGTYSTPFIEHAYLEPEAALAVPEAGGLIHVFTPTQNSHAFRDQIAASLNLPKDKVRVTLVTTGGAFGGREETTVQIHCALGALKTGRPVKMVLTREESIRMSYKRHPAYIKCKTGASRDGKLQAFKAEIYLDTGAYASAGVPVATRVASFAAGPYEVPNVKVDVYAVYTNNQPAGAMRGFGSPQGAFAAEQQMDILAEKLDMDPISLREINALEKGKSTITGHVLVGGVGLKGCLQAVRDYLDKIELPKSEGTKKIGVGIAAGHKNVGLGCGLLEKAGVEVALQEDGSVDLRLGCTENGQGIFTAAAQIAAQATGISYSRFLVQGSDTHETPDAGMTTGSRMVFLTGNAVYEAAGLFKKEICRVAGIILGMKEDHLVFEDEVVKNRSGKVMLTLEELARQAFSAGLAIKVEHTYDGPKTHPIAKHVESYPSDPSQNNLHYAYCFGAHGAVVEVDEETGETKVLKYIAAHDAGKAIHLHSVEGQIEGGVVMGLGYALTEEFVVEKGWLKTDDLRKLGIPKIDILPEITTVVVEEVDPRGPFGAKGMGELPVTPVAPAICNAIYDAVGVRCTEIPVIPARLKKLIEDRKNCSEGGCRT